jgi:hypothetical protein
MIRTIVVGPTIKKKKKKKKEKKRKEVVGLKTEKIMVFHS